MATPENQTLKALRALAKERGLKRYSHLRKAELVAQVAMVAMLKAKVAMLQPRNIMDESVPNIGVTSLVIPHSITRSVRNAVAAIGNFLILEHLKPSM